MKRILIILFYFYVSFELMSLDLNLVCKFQSGMSSYPKPNLYTRNDMANPIEQDGFFIVKGRNIRSNLMNLIFPLDPIEILDVKETDIFILVRQSQQDGYFEIKIDRYTGSMKTNFFDEKIDRNENYQMLEYVCSRGSKKF